MQTSDRMFCISLFECLANRRTYGEGTVQGLLQAAQRRSMSHGDSGGLGGRGKGPLHAALHGPLQVCLGDKALRRKRDGIVR